MKIDRTVQMLTLFVAMTLLFINVRPNEPTSGISVEEYVYQKIYAKNKYEVVFAGDSTVESGVNCDEFILVSGHSNAFNFGFGGGGFYKIYLQAVEEHVDTNSLRPTIIIGITPRSLEEHAVNNNNFNKWSREYSADSFSYLIPPAWKYAFRPIQALNMHEALRGGHSGYSWIMHTNGWVATSKIPETDYVEHEDEFDRLGNYEVSERMVAMLSRACNRWTAKGISVYVYLSPTAGDSLFEGMKKAGLEPSELKQLIEKSGATWLPVSDRDYHYCDGVHIHFDDAPRFSRDLAEAYLKAGRVMKRSDSAELLP